MLTIDGDRDGLPDHWERTYGFDPLDPADATADADGDGIPNGSDRGDSDGDGPPDNADTAPAGDSSDPNDPDPENATFVLGVVVKGGANQRYDIGAFIP